MTGMGAGGFRRRPAAVSGTMLAADLRRRRGMRAFVCYHSLPSFPGAARHHIASYHIAAI